MRKKTAVICRVVFTTIASAILLVLILMELSRDDEPTSVTAKHRSEADAKSCEFKIFWPLAGPQESSRPKDRPLLFGKVNIWSEELGTPEAGMVIGISLTRPHDEAARKFWNTRLAYTQYGWMDRVRVWDKERQWIWPNLSYLFKIHGRDRIERYGGWDPGNHVDNDFGAVLVKDDNSMELVSADWYPVDVDRSDRYTVSHVTRSDYFTVRIGKGRQPCQGRLKVWLIYADFMRHKVPKNWPKRKEYNGGTLAAFTIDWKYESGKRFDAVITPVVPEHTGFKWEQWSGRKTQAQNHKAPSKLAM